MSVLGVLRHGRRGRLKRGLRRGARGRLGRRVGARQLDHRQREPLELHTGVVDGAVDRDGVHEQRVLLALIEGVGVDRGLLVGGVRAQEDAVALVANLPVVAGDVALGVPAQRDDARLHVVDAALHAGHGLDRDLGVADGADLRHDGDLHALEAGGAARHVRGIAVHRVGGDLDGVEHIVGQRRHGHARLRQHRPVVAVGVAVLVVDVHVVLGDRALGEPVEGDVAAGGAVVGHAVDVVLHAIEVVEADDRLADVGRRHVDGGVRREQQLLRAHGGHARGLEADLHLEQLHGLLGGLAEAARDLAVIVAQLLQAALQALHAAVLVAAAQRDVAGGLRRVVGEQRPEHRHGGLTGLAQARRALEHADSRGGLGGVAAAHGAFEVVQVAQAVVQLAHAIARVAGIQVDEAGAAVGPVGVEQLQSLARGLIVHGQAVFLLEQLHGLLGARPEDAVRDVGQIAQLAQALLHADNAQAAAASGQLLVGIVGLEVAREDRALQIGVRHAVHDQPQIVLEHFDGVLRAGAEDAVHVVVVVAEVVQRLLDGAHGVAAAAAVERGVLLDGLELVPRGGLAGDGELLDQIEGRLGHLGLGAELDEGEVGLGGVLRQLRVHVQLAAHGFNLQPRDAVAVGDAVAAEIGVALVHGERALGGVHGVDGVVRAEHEQRVGAGGQLALHGRLGREHHVGGLGGGVVLHQPHGASGVGEVVDHAVHPGVGQHVAVQELGAVVEGVAEVEVALVGEVHLVVLRQQAASGQRGHVGLKLPGLAHVHERPGLIHQLDHHALGGQVQPVDGLGRGVDRLGAHVLEQRAHEHLAVGVGDVADGVRRLHAGRMYVARHARFLVGRQVDLIEALGPVGLVLAQEHHAIGVGGEDAVGAGLVDGVAATGQVEVAASVHIGGNGAAAAHGIGLRRSEAQRRQAQREQQEKHAGFFHNYTLL